jgi:hypothetical protein
MDELKNTYNGTEAVKMGTRAMPWALMLTVGLGVAKWGFGLAIPTGFVFLPILLPWLILLGIAVLVLAAIVVFAICTFIWTLIEATARTITEAGHRKSRRDIGANFRVVRP